MRIKWRSWVGTHWGLEELEETALSHSGESEELHLI